MTALVSAVQLDALVNFGMLALIVWDYFCYLGGFKTADVFNLAAHGVRVEAVVQSSLAGEQWAVTACDMYSWQGSGSGFQESLNSARNQK